MNKWNDEMQEYMVFLISENLTFSQTANAINERYGTHFTRNAISGKWHRFVKDNNYD